MARQMENATGDFGRSRPGTEKQIYVLRLYVLGFTPASTRAITNLNALCEAHLNGRFELEVIDILQRPALARGEQILPTPTLLKLLPVPMQRFIGDLSGVEGKLFGLDLRSRRGEPRRQG
ncbi:MAG TPA: circadian clock KaiB family protein [Bryobacteraceae bacterium]|nr:circadian clock KaiB family protein [Bryobacteraceae bacterium]